MKNYRQQLLFDLGHPDMPKAPAQTHSITSVAAAEAIRPELSELHRKVLGLFREATDGLTDEELIDLMARSPSTVRPRRIELVGLGMVKDMGLTRPGRSGRQMTVWVLK